MKLPYLSEDIARKLSGQASKVLIYLAGERPVGSVVRVTCVNAALACKMCPDSWRGAVRELAGAGILEAESSTAGYKVKIHPPSRRFTWLPSLSNNLWMQVSPRSCKVALCLARSATGRVNSVRMKISTMCGRVGMGRRTVQIAIRELVDRMILTSHRTPRSSWYVFIKQPAKQIRDLFEDQPAPHWKMCVRLLYSYPLEYLTKMLPTVKRKKEGVARLIRQHLMGGGQITEEGRLWRKTVTKHYGVDWDEATCMALEYTEAERRRAVSLLTGSRPRDASAWLQTALERGWCAT